MIQVMVMKNERIEKVESLLLEAKETLKAEKENTNSSRLRKRYVNAYENSCELFGLEKVELEEDRSKDDVYSEWKDHVNMTASELQKWSKNPCSRQASKDPVAVMKRNLRLLEKNKEDWTSEDVKDAERTISFINRMRANKPDSPREGPHGCPSEWAISLLNWAFNPFDSVPTPSSEVKEDLDPVDKVNLSALKGFEFEEDDEVAWESSGGQAYGVVRDRSDDSCYDASIDGDVKVCGEDDNPAYLIQIWNQEKRQLEDTMVAHKEDTLNATNLDIESSKLSEGEFVPDHVVYSEKDVAMERAESMGLEGVHEHVLVLGGEEVTMYIPGSEHSDWAEKVRHPRQLEDKDLSESRKASEVFHSNEQERMKDDGESSSVRVPPVAIHRVDGEANHKVSEDVEDVLNELWSENNEE